MKCIPLKNTLLGEWGKRHGRMCCLTQAACMLSQLTQKKWSLLLSTFFVRRDKLYPLHDVLHQRKLFCWLQWHHLTMFLSSNGCKGLRLFNIWTLCYSVFQPNHIQFVEVFQFCGMLWKAELSHYETAQSFYTATLWLEIHFEFKVTHVQNFLLFFLSQPPNVNVLALCSRHKTLTLTQ